MPTHPPTNKVVQRTWLVWAWSFGINTALVLVLSVQDYYLGRSEGSHPNFWRILLPGLVSFWIYAALTPPVLWLCWNYPIQRKRFFSRLSLHFAASLLFTIIHVTLRILIYPRIGAKVIGLTPAVWKMMFLYFAFDNIVNTYAMIAFLGHMMLSYHELRARELRSAQLEGKLAKAQLSMLKMQLQPHFLFNTLHTIATLVDDEPRLARQMIARLGDFLSLQPAAPLGPEPQPESPLELTLAVALLKGEKFDLVVQKTTELGVTSIQPVVTERADVRVRDNQDAIKRVTRWQRIALEAAKQSGRARVPDFLSPIDLPSLLENPFAQAEETESLDRLCLMFSEHDGEPLSQTLAGQSAPPARVMALVGAEGGWTDNEIEQTRAAGWSVVTLSGRTMRAETAAIAVVALLQNLLGDLD